MANALYGPGREGFLAGEIDWDTAVIKVAAVRLTAGGAAVFTSTQKFMSELLTTHTIHGTPATLASKTVTNGTADAADLSPAYAALAANANAHVLVIFQASAVTGGADVATSSQRLIAWIDTGTNIPFTPNGGDVNIAWDNGANKIFTL
jgi:hypothetical protein